MTAFWRAAFAAGFVFFAGAGEAMSASFSDLPNWSEDDHASAWVVFHRSCQLIVKKAPPARPGKEQTVALHKICRQAVRLPAALGSKQAKTFFEAHFMPVKLNGGFMTGYYEPEFQAARKPSAKFSVPVLRRPKDLVSTVAPPGYPELTAARRAGNGTLSPFPDRVAIENGALKEEHLEIFWMQDAFELFTMQVQGSGRLRLTDGTRARLAYDGKNGHPYTAIGKVLLDRGILKKGEVSMQAIGAAFKRDPALAHDVMRQNKSYVFFRELKNADPSRGPIGGQGLALTPFRSIAIDRNIHSYGLPFFVYGGMPGVNHMDEFNRLMIAQDTGTAIVGQARIDLFTGWGAQAAELAGLMQQKIDLYLLQPKDEE